MFACVLNNSQFITANNSKAEKVSTPFSCELEAYTHLTHYGACKKGVVRSFFGWLTLSKDQLEDIKTVPGIPSEALSLSYEEEGPEALLLEYIPKAEALSINTITLQVAHSTLRALCDIHGSYVHRGTINTQNILIVLAESGEGVSRVLWTDFTHAKCASDQGLRRQVFYFELHKAWDYLHGRLVSSFSLVSTSL